MPEQPQKPPQSPLASLEADLFGSLLGFHKNVMTLLRQSSLDDKRNVVGERINTLLDKITAEMKLTQHLNLRERLEAAYDEVKRLVDEFGAET